jgi:UDP-N-acetylmuramoyl-L-alanyl-D-glutamate--2,6-diaminopimelate ligase
MRDMKKLLKKLVPQKLINQYHRAVALFWAFKYGWPSRKLIVIGVTGTNGKTTTCQLIAKILEIAGYKVGLASTINFKIGNKEWVNSTKMTSPDSRTLQKMSKEMVQAGCQYAVVETSSHALDQYRVEGIDYDVAVMTNLTREHLDYHKTMENYQTAKGKLFRDLKKKKNKNLFGHRISKVSILNLNDVTFAEFRKFSADDHYGYRVFENDRGMLSDNNVDLVEAYGLRLDIDSSEFLLVTSKGKNNVILKLPGEFNVENSLAAATVGFSQGVQLKDIVKGLESVISIPGRMEEIINDRGFKIFIDYAVTPDSLSKLKQLIEKINYKKLIWVFGSCGDRDKGKRPMMGRIVGEASDFVIVTNEDPYSEDPQIIIDAVAQGVGETLGFEQENKSWWRITDRREAISYALNELAKPGDVVLITGKGAETTMAISSTERIKWDERDVIQKILDKRN